jgi:hypothetical protein
MVSWRLKLNRGTSRSCFVQATYWNRCRRKCSYKCYRCHVITWPDVHAKLKIDKYINNIKWTIISTIFCISVCEQGSYGQNCENVCACVPSNTASCNSVDGTCTCKAGWEGTTCNLNINECTRNTFTCPLLSTCEDNDGSYVCNCNAGYQKDSNQQCIGKNVNKQSNTFIQNPKKFL